jgi:hypothetical protein
MEALARSPSRLAYALSCRGRSFRAAQAFLYLGSIAQFAPPHPDATKRAVGSTQRFARANAAAKPVSSATMRSILKTKVERDIRYALGRSLRQPRAGHAQPTVKNVLLDSAVRRKITVKC